MPKAVGKPVYSYRLSIVHFWALVFMYIWAGPHHLLNTSLPDWAQTLGMIFSVVLWAPSWGGMINGLLTLRGAWDKLRTDPIVKFFAAAITFYGMSTFEGPMLSIKSVNALAHGTDWIIGHVHLGALGWNGFMAAGMFYWLMPRLFNTKLFSEKLANLHFWAALVGILLYVVAMYSSGLTQGLMWRALSEDGTLLYPSFLEAIVKSLNMYYIRTIGGGLYLVGYILMIYNLVKTACSGEAHDGSATVTVDEDHATNEVGALRLIFSPTMLVMVVGVVLIIVMGTHDKVQSILGLVGLGVLVVVATIITSRKIDRPGNQSWHQVLETKPMLFTVLTLLAILVGGLVQIVPALTMKEAIPLKQNAVPYSALQAAGRDIYMREGCYYCHTQMVRSLISEVTRYGKASEAWEAMYDHPFQWGSKNTGPDLARVGGKYPDVWHYRHMINPREISNGSIMPNYSFLEKQSINQELLAKRLSVLRMVGVPYTDDQIANAQADAKAEAEVIVNNLKVSQIEINWDSDLVALISYLQKLGADMKKLGANP